MRRVRRMPCGTVIYTSLARSVSSRRTARRRAGFCRRRERAEALVRTSLISCRGCYPRFFRGYLRHVIFASGGPRRNHGMAAKVRRPGRGGNGWTAMILRCEVLPILARGLLMMRLLRQRRGMRFVRCRLFLRGRYSLHPAFSAIEACSGSTVDDDRAVIDVGHAAHADVGDVAVVVERSATPLAAHESHPAIAESVVNPTIKTNVRTPVPRVPGIE